MRQRTPRRATAACTVRWAPAVAPCPVARPATARHSGTQTSAFSRLGCTAGRTDSTGPCESLPWLSAADPHPAAASPGAQESSSAPASWRPSAGTRRRRPLALRRRRRSLPSALLHRLSTRRLPALSPAGGRRRLAASVMALRPPWTRRHPRAARAPPRSGGVTSSRSCSSLSSLSSRLVRLRPFVHSK